MASIALAITTSTATQSVGLAVDDRPLAVRTMTWRRGQPRTLLRDITELLNEAGKVLHDVDRIVCDVGPGSFTGLRFSMATARALAWSLGIPCHGVGSLQTIAFMATQQGAQGPVLAVLPARRRVVYARVGDVEAEVPHAELPEFVDAAPDKPQAIAGPSACLEELASLDLPQRPVPAPDIAAMLGLAETTKPVDWAALTPSYVALSQPERIANAAQSSR